MTREDAIKEVKMYDHFPNGISKECRDYIIKALKQDPNDDCVSRAEVLNLVRFNAFHVKSQIKAIENLPPVKPVACIAKEPTAYRRYRDLLEYFGNDLILEDDEEFKRWLERIRWHIKKANELYQKYECQKEPCKDAVSRKSVLNQIFYSTDNSGDVVLGSNLRKRIEELPPVTPTQKWIPCSERFPEEKDGYLVTVHGYVTTALWVGHAEYWDKVTAWMPLPKPYQTESEEAE